MNRVSCNTQSTSCSRAFLGTFPKQNCLFFPCGHAGVQTYFFAFYLQQCFLFCLALRMQRKNGWTFFDLHLAWTALEINFERFSLHMFWTTHPFVEHILHEINMPLSLFFPRKGSWTRGLQTIQDNIQMKRRLRCARTIEHTISQNYWHFLLAKNMCLNELQYMWTFLDGSNLFCLWHWYVFSLSCYCQGT